MSFNVADLVATLRVDRGSFDRDIAGAGQQVQGLGAMASRAGDSFRQDLTAGVQATSLAIMALGTAAAVTLSKVFDTGVAYNTLQQTSRAALRTLLGGAQQANAQMDKLDAFARTSPFSKAVFITAQQQLIGFGTEAERVIPILSAINDAVAAMGGSNEDIAGISFALAQVAGVGKITGDTLMQLGQRGIDAAKIIGDGMGMTTEEVRKGITEATIDSEAALTVLIEGMQTKFAGAAANVKETMTGASDRVAAATRDIGAALAEPFVSKNGGGRLVQWTNDWADALRAVESRVPAVTSLVLARLSPALSQVSVVIGDVKDAVKDFDLNVVNRGLDQLVAHAPAFAALTGAVIGFSGGALGAIPVVGGLLASLNPLALAIAAVVAVSPQLRSGLVDVAREFQPLLPVVGELAGALSNALSSAVSATVPLLTTAATVASALVTALIPLLDGVAFLAEGFTQLPGPVQTGIVAFGALLFLLPMLNTATAAVGTSFTRLTGQIAAAGVAATASKGIGALFTMMGGPWMLVIAGAAAALGMYSASQQKAKEAAQAHTQALDEQTGAITAQNREIAATAIANDRNDGFYLFSSGAKSASESLKLLGKSVQDTGNIVAEGGEPYDRMIATLEEGKLALSEAGSQTDEYGRVVEGSSARFDTWAASLGRGSGFLKQLTESDMTHLLDVLQKQREAVGSATNAWDLANDSQAEGTKVTTELADAIRQVGDESSNSADRVNAYKDVIDALNGKVPTAAEQQRDLAKSSRTLAEFLNQVDGAGQKVGLSLVDASTGAIALNDQGDQLQSMLGTLQEKGLAAALSASDFAKANGNAAGAAAAADAALAPFKATLQDLANQGLLTQDQVNALSTSLFGVPGETTAVITDGNSASAVRLQVEELTRKVNAVPDKNITITEPMSPAVMARLQALGYSVQTLPNGNINITTTGVQSAENQLNWTARERTAIIRAHTVNTGASDAGYSSGGGVGGLAAGGLVEFYANGGTRGIPPLVPMSAVAAIVPPNTYRVVGDNAHVPEIYAPINGSARSLEIMRQGADRMGFQMVPKGALRMFADGGTNNLPAGSTSAAPAQEAGATERHLHLHYGNVQTSDPAEFHRKNQRDLRDALALFDPK